MKKILYFLKIILHNHKYFKNIKKNTNKLILVEYNRLSSSIISYSYLSHILSKKLDAKICAYRQTAKKSIVKDLIWIILSKIKFFNTFQIYKSFGTQNFYLPNNFSLKNKYQTKIYKIIKDIKNKNDLLDLSIDNIYVGDLFYDSYLMDFHKETINLEDPIFKNYLKDVLRNFFLWKDFFKKNDVRAVVTSHGTYTLAIPLRIAISKNILAFQCTAGHLYSLSKKNLYAYKEFLNYKFFFSGIDKKVKSKIINLAKKKLTKKFRENIINYEFGSTKSAYSKKIIDRVIKKNNKFKVLIVPHCFFDNPHAYGKNLFVDMYEWLEFLGKISKKTNYDWYIKLHPDFLDGTKEIIDKFLKRYPSIIYIPNDYSHNQLLREGINVALTCFGSIAHEYPLLNKLVVNCSLNNPHINYNFSLHPKNIKNYKNILFKLHSVKNNVRKNELYEFYAMFNILRKGWLIDEFNSLVSSRGMNFIFLPDFYNYWIKKNFKVSKHEQILKKISKFIDSNDYLMDWNHKEINRRIF